MKLSQVPRLWRTVRHLRSEQVVGQMRVRIGRLGRGPGRVADGKKRMWPGVRWQPRCDWLAPGPQLHSADQIRSGKLAFVGQTHDVGWPPRWDDAAMPSRLWQYNLHYLEYLWALSYEDARVLVRHWIEHHPPARHHAGWEPYPTSLRLVNLCCVMFGRYRERTEVDTAFRDELFQSIFQQTEWLRANLETHIQANHLLENAVAMAMVGACFEGAEAARWRSEGYALLRQELAEQVLADGGHYERSPMYHVRIAYALALLVNTGDGEAASLVGPVLKRMIDALRVMCHPDGEIALLNDSAVQVYNRPGQLIDYAAKLLDVSSGATRIGSNALANTGYYTGCNVRGDYVICDAGAIGPDHQPGHAHGDLLSFEMSCRGRRLIVDAGNFDYEASAMRAYCRSTRAHNTVEVEGRDQCEFWGAFRVGRRARVRDVQYQQHERGFRLSASHDGYRWLAGRPTHERTFVWHDEGVLLVRDVVRAAGSVNAVARLHLHPDWRIDDMEDSRVTVSRGELRAMLLFTGDVRPQRDPEPNWYCPRFGERIASEVIMLRASGGVMRFGFAIVADMMDATLDMERGLKIGGRTYEW